MTEPIIRECIITGNESSNIGGALHARQSYVVLENCIIAGNAATEAGGGISQCCCSTVNIVNCTIANNIAPIGAGIQFYPSAIPRLTNTIVALCGPGAGISGAGGNDRCRLRIVGCNLFGNVGGNFSECSIIEESDTEYISLDPLFGNPESGDYRLQEDSPCTSKNRPSGNQIGAQCWKL